MKLGALEKLATDTATPARMTVIDMDTDRPLLGADGKECYIEFLPIDSDAGRRLDRERAVAGRRKIVSGRNRQDDDDPVEQQIETVVTLATGWNFGPDSEQFSKKAAQELFANPEFGWLMRQSWTFVYTAANFIKSSSKGS